jgi:uncharacterized protein (TIGR02001 family)
MRSSVRRLAMVSAFGAAFLYGMGESHAADTGFSLGDGLGTISPTIDATTNYVFRGISQTRHEPAIQGTVEYTNEIGPVTPYLGMFLSNVKFPDTTNRDNLDIKIEQDLYGGIRWELADVNWDVGYIRYRYPSTDLPTNNSASPDWTEVYIKLNHDFEFMKLYGSWFHSWKYSTEGGAADYFNAGPDVPLPWYDITFGTRVGHLSARQNTNLGYPDYWDINVGLNRDFPEIFGVNMAINFYDTTIGRGSVTNNSNDNAGSVDNRVYNTVGPQFAFTVTKAF